jgi:hypothetical protein
MAERGGFEPPEHLRAQRFSRPPHSTALASLHGHINPSKGRRASAVHNPAPPADKVLFRKRMERTEGVECNAKPRFRLWETGFRYSSVPCVRTGRCAAASKSKPRSHDMKSTIVQGIRQARWRRARWRRERDSNPRSTFALTRFPVVPIKPALASLRIDCLQTGSVGARGFERTLHQFAAGRL